MISLLLEREKTFNNIHGGYRAFSVCFGSVHNAVS